MSFFFFIKKNLGNLIASITLFYRIMEVRNEDSSMTLFYRTMEVRNFKHEDS
jgi:hypothetical protein